MLQIINQDFVGYRIPTIEEKQVILKYVQELATKDGTAAKVISILVIVLGVFVLLGAFAVPKNKALYALVGVVFISIGIIVQVNTANRRNKVIAYGKTNISVLDCICTDAKLTSTPNSAVDNGKVKVKTLDGQISDEWFTVDAYTVSQNKAIGERMLLVKFGDEGHLMFTDAMLGK